MNTIWQRFIKLNDDNEDLSLEKKRQISLTNQLAIISFITLVTGAVFDFFIREYFIGLIVLFCAPIQIISILLNKVKKYNAASFSLMLIINITIFYFSSFCGFESGAFLYFFPFIVGMALLFELNGNRNQFIFHFILVIFFLLILNLTRENLFYNATLSETSIRLMFIFNSIASIILIAYYTYIINKSNQEVKKNFQQIITQKNKAESILKSSLSDKETLLSEVHHRVKNNLAVVTSLLNLKMDSVTNPYTKQVLLECKNRVLSMSLIHEKLYRSKNFSNLNFKLYVDELITEIKSSYPIHNKNIKIDIASDDIILDLSSAIPCGLILNELITNSYKHAFIDGQAGEINVLVNKRNNQIEMIVSDNGIGFNKNTENTNSLGIILVESLTEQLEGKAAYIFTEGTKFILTFAINEKN